MNGTKVLFLDDTDTARVGTVVERSHFVDGLVIIEHEELGIVSRFEDDIDVITKYQDSETAARRAAIRTMIQNSMAGT